MSSWLARHENVRKAFGCLAWVSLGQTPDLPHIQQIVLQQLTGGRFTGEESDEQRKLSLQIF